MHPDLASFKPEIKPGTYRHYKGALYRVFATVTHSETEEVMVLYAPLKPSSDVPRLWVRPLSMFCETVTTHTGDVARFSYIGES